MKNFIQLRWLLAVWIAFVFLQSLFFKFSGSPETRHIFGVLGAWSGLDWFAHYGAFVVGGAELLASIVLLTRYWAWGALLALGIMSGAIIFHVFTPLGIAMPIFENGMNTGETDGGLLFIMACLTWLAAAILLFKDYKDEGGAIKRVLALKTS